MRKTWPLAVAMAAPLLVVAAQFTAVRPTNFAGHDEFLNLSLASRGLVSFPYADRPLNLIFSVPGTLLTPHDVIGHQWTAVAFFAAGGALVGWLALRLGLTPTAALVAGVLAATWAPLDGSRLNVLQVGARYAGCMALAVGGLVLFVEAFLRARPFLAVAGIAMGGIGVLCSEGALPVLAAAPFVVLAAHPALVRPGAERRRLLRWSAAWWLLLALSVLPLVLSLAGMRSGYRYQSAVGLDPHPVRLGGALLRQLSYSLAPLFSSPLAELARGSVLLATAVFAIAFAALRTCAGAEDPEPHDRRTIVRAAAVGLGLAVLGWIAFVVSPLVRTPERNQILSAPGVAVLLASVFALAATRVPPRARPFVVALAGAWVVAVGAGRVAALQDEWDRKTFWPGQRGSLVQLVAQAPALAPNTVVLLVDETQTWKVNFAFTHAIHYLYGERVVGLVWKGHEFLYSARLEPEGIHREPWPVIQRAWRSPPTLHRYDEVLAARLSAGGRLVLLDEWPPDLPPLPPGAAYAPRARIGPGPPAPSSRILDRER